MRTTLFAIAVTIFMAFGNALAAPTIVSETFFIDSQEPNLKLYLLNKHAEGAKNYSEDKIILFVHGGTYPSETAFDLALPGGSWMDYAAERGYDTYLVDIRGFGKSSRPASMNLPPDKNPPFATTTEAVQDVSAAVDYILKRRGVSKLNLVGWSWGTTIMAGYTTQNNDKVSKLVLYAPIWVLKGAPPDWALKSAALGAYRSVGKEGVRTRGIRGIPPNRVEEISPSSWSETWWSAVQPHRSPKLTRGMLKNLTHPLPGRVGLW